MSLVPKEMLPQGMRGNWSINDLPQLDNPISWSSMTGVDMVAMFRFEDIKFDDKEDDPLAHFKVFAELQTISISATRSVHPVRCLGESAARAYTRGARTFAGSLIFTMFDRDPFEDVSRLAVDQEKFDGREPFFIDQIPEFDIIITAVNEYGAVSKALLGGVTLTNYGTTLSIHDIYTEISYTYVARWYIPMTADLRAFDKIRRLEFQPMAAAAGNFAEKQIDTNEKGVRVTAAEMLEQMRAGTPAGKFVRGFKG